MGAALQPSPAAAYIINIATTHLPDAADAAATDATDATAAATYITHCLYHQYCDDTPTRCC